MNFVRKMLRLVGVKTRPRSAFSTFFVEASSATKARIIKASVREANAAQRQLVEKYGKVS
jgi:hypothetical protein